jgi:glucan 1,3-beta-glucosidase
LSQGASASYPWPPRSLIDIGAGEMSSIAQFTQTGTPLTAPAPTFTSPGGSATIDAGDGWAQPSNSRLAYVPVSGCTYPPEYSAVDMQPSAGVCGAGRVAPTPRAVMPVATGAA